MQISAETHYRLNASTSVVALRYRGERGESAKTTETKQVLFSTVRPSRRGGNSLAEKMSSVPTMCAVHGVGLLLLPRDCCSLVFDLFVPPLPATHHRQRSGIDRIDYVQPSSVSRVLTRKSCYCELTRAILLIASISVLLQVSS